MPFTDSEILDGAMFELETFDIRTTTLGISLLDCADPTSVGGREGLHQDRLRPQPGGGRRRDRGGPRRPIINKRVSTTPSRWWRRRRPRRPRALRPRHARGGGGDRDRLHRRLHRLRPQGLHARRRGAANSIPQALAETGASARASPSPRRSRDQHGRRQVRPGRPRHRKLTADEGGLGCAKLVCFSNPVEDNPFIAGAHIGIGEPETVLNVGVSAWSRPKERLGLEADLLSVAETIKRTAFKITRMGGLWAARPRGGWGRSSASSTSPAPTPAVGDRSRTSSSSSASSAPARPAPRRPSRCRGRRQEGRRHGVVVGRRLGAFIPVSEDRA